MSLDCVVARTPRAEAETVERLDDLRVEGQSYDDVASELADIYEAEQLSLQHGGDGA